MYFLSRDPATSPKSLKQLRERVRRADYRISADYATGIFPLIDARLRLPLLGLDYVGLAEIAHAVEQLGNKS
jgi:hypothetical protein